MSDQIKRPVFFEGQILGAVDLEAMVEYARGQKARHERYEHTPGIAEGLTLSKKPKQLEKEGVTIDYQEIWLSPGLAIDGRGREIVVPEAKRLSENDFDQLNVAITDPAALYPVLLLGRDTTAPVSAFNVGDCAGAAPTRQIEDYEIRFKGPGENLDLDSPTPSAVSDGPVSSAGDAWMLLLGFVSWNRDIQKFSGFEETSAGTGRRYVGVLADEVAARGGKLLLRTQPKNQSGKPAVLLDETEGGEFKFGALNAAGALVPVLTVKANGDIITPGVIQSKSSSGSVYVQSGIAADGVVLPLPTGVEPEAVEPGKGTLHIQVNLRPNGVPPPTAVDTWGAFPLECSVDADRRVRCRVRWLKLAAALTVEDRPGVCDYVLLVAIPATAGG